MKKVFAVGILMSMVLAAGNTARGAAGESAVAADGSAMVPADGSYEAYIGEHAAAGTEVSAFAVRLAEENAIDDGEEVRLTQPGEYGSDASAIYIEEGGFLELVVQVPQEGLYNIGLDYYSVEGRGQEIRQSLMIDGAYPFEEAEQIVLSRIWKDEGEVACDAEGNDLYPDQIQTPEWTACYFRDSKGYVSDPFLFYLTEGEHRLRFTSIEEPLVIRSVLFAPKREIPSYEEALADYRAAGYSEVPDYFFKRQAEDMDKKSSSMLTAAADRSDPAVEPYDGLKIKLNVLGGGRFDTNGMWVEYTVEAPSDGLYRLIFKAKQNNMKDQSAYRNIYINGELPFEEARNFPFSYSDKYENVIFGNEEGAYLVKLNEGPNTIRLEASLGDISVFCQGLEESLEILNSAYRKIVTITGTTPDANRDYSLDYKMPDVIRTFEEQAGVLARISEAIKTRYGQSTSHTAPIDALVIQLEDMYEDHYDIPVNVSSFHTNLSTLGSKVEEMKRTDLTLDYICITGTENKLPRPMAGFLQKIGFSVRNFIASFFKDYSIIGSTGDYDETIEVWMIGGREQAQILKQIINSDFSAESGIGVNVKLISDAVTLQQATMAGEGPDVALGLPQADAMNFAFRGATRDLTKFEDFEEVSRRFTHSAIGVLTYGDGVMGIPQTMDFPVLFYREDILEELQLEVPRTWDDVYELLPVLAQNNMSFGLPLDSSFGILLYQRGGKYYGEDLSSVTFSEELTIETMTDWSELYISYGLPLSYDFVNRFAAGDMPLAVQSYSAYATLILYAPQLANVWGWTPVPGTVREDGGVDHSVPIYVTASVILSDTEKEDASWEFVKWWTGEDTQVEFGRSIENLLGKAGRYNTANIGAMERLPWPGRLYKNLKGQMEQTIAVPEIPGGYYTNRYLNNAFWELYSDNEKGGFEVRKVMYQYDLIVDNEIAYQRKALKRAADNEGRQRRE